MLVFWNWEHVVGLCAVLMILERLMLLGCKHMQRQLVKLLQICHSKLDKVVPENASVRYSL